MLWHCGLLSERPDRDRTLEWIRRGSWNSGLPEDVERELRIWLAMPGFTAAFHAHNFGVSSGVVRRQLGGYEKFKREVGQNWLSATREDCVRLSQLRPPRGDLPLLSQLQIIDDVKAGHRRRDLMREYLTNTATIHRLAQGLVLFGKRPLPPGFELLVGPLSCSGS